MKRVLIVLGTRPEAIKLAPVVLELRRRAGFDVIVCSTGQHRQLLDGVLGVFGIVPDLDLKLMALGQTLSELAGRALAQLDRVLVTTAPDIVVAQGDTTTATVAALAGFHRRIPVVHVEAGLRTGDRSRPFPEEVNRRLVGVLADLHLAPTYDAKLNLVHEGIAREAVVVTGNTVIDALQHVCHRLDTDPDLASLAVAKLPPIDAAKRMILVTSHRRENFGEGFRNICWALRRLATRHDVEIVFPVHLNPNVRGPVVDLLGGQPNVHLLDPLDYLSFVAAMRRSHMILTDSGGVQEEAPSVNVPVLVMREVTERREAIAAGVARLVGTGVGTIVAAASELLDDPRSHARMAVQASPYGDGQAAHRIADKLSGQEVSDWNTARLPATMAA